MTRPSSGALVYSTESGRICPDCRQPLAQCGCKAALKAALKAAPAGDGTVRVSLQSKGRGGKSVTLVKGLALDCAALAALGKQLRTRCGCGGTVKDGVIEVQGEHCELVLHTLIALGHRAKRAGG